MIKYSILILVCSGILIGAPSIAHAKTRPVPKMEPNPLIIKPVLETAKFVDDNIVLVAARKPKANPKGKLTSRQKTDFKRKKKKLTKKKRVAKSALKAATKNENKTSKALDKATNNARKSRTNLNNKNKKLQLQKTKVENLTGLRKAVGRARVAAMQRSYDKAIAKHQNGPRSIYTAAKQDYIKALAVQKAASVQLSNSKNALAVRKENKNYARRQNLLRAIDKKVAKQKRRGAAPRLQQRSQGPVISKPIAGFPASSPQSKPHVYDRVPPLNPKSQYGPAPKALNDFTPVPVQAKIIYDRFLPSAAQ